MIFEFTCRRVGCGYPDVGSIVRLLPSSIVYIHLAVMIVPFRSPERRLGPFRLLLEYVSGLFPVDQVFRSEYRIVGSPFGGSPCYIISIVNPYDGRVGDVPANNGISEIGLFLGHTCDGIQNRA